MADRNLATYALVRALYDQGKDYIDAFWPFLLRVLPLDKGLVSVEEVADSVSRAYGLSVPVHTAKTLIERAKRKHGFVRRERGRYALTDAGVSYVEASETPAEVNRRLNAFVLGAVAFFTGRYPELAESTQAEEAIRAVIDRNVLVVDYATARPFTGRSVHGVKGEKAVMEYFANVEDADPQGFATLQDLILGSIIAGLLPQTDISETTRHFRGTRFYLDTNFILSLLDLRYPVECRPADELFRLINRNSGIGLCVYDFTIQEVIGVLRGYATEGRKYPEGAKINSIYAAMKFRGYTPASVTELIARLPDDLNKLGVRQITTGINLKDIPEPSAEVIQRLARYKPDQDRRGQLHDLTAISKVAQERKRAEYRKAEQPEAYLLTEDYKLSQYAFIEGGHRANGTISEVISDRLLTNLLWLKEPEMLSELPIEAAIALHSRDLFIDRRVWKRFYSVVEGLLRDNLVDEDAAMILIYDAHVQHDLLELGEDTTGVDAEWAIERLEEARERTHEQREWELKKKEAEITELHQKELAEVITERASLASRLDLLERKLANNEARMEGRRKRWEADQKRKAVREASWVLYGSQVGLLAVLATIAYRLGPTILGWWDQVAPYEGLIALVVTIVLAVFGVRLDPLSIRSRIHTRVSDWRLRRRLSEGAMWFNDDGPDSETHA